MLLTLHSTCDSLSHGCIRADNIPIPKLLRHMFHPNEWINSAMHHQCQGLTRVKSTFHCDAHAQRPMCCQQDKERHHSLQTAQIRGRRRKRPRAAQSGTNKSRQGVLLRPQEQVAAALADRELARAAGVQDWEWATSTLLCTADR